MVRELRHDFRAYYHVGYDEVEADEAIDLIATLPQGSLYRSAMDPAASWSPERHMNADLMDQLMVVAWGLGAYVGEEPPRVVRPADRIARAAEASRAASAKRRREQTKWREVEDGGESR